MRVQRVPPDQPDVSIVITWDEIMTENYWGDYRRAHDNRELRLYELRRQLFMVWHG